MIEQQNFIFTFLHRSFLHSCGNKISGNKYKSTDCRSAFAFTFYRLLPVAAYYAVVVAYVQLSVLLFSAAQIHVPSFDATSYLRYPALGNSALSFLELEIAFKPYSSDGTILYEGNLKQDGAPEDFILLAMTDGYLEFICDLGTGQAKIRWY